MRYEDLKNPGTRQNLANYLKVCITDANELSRIVEPSVVDHEPPYKKRYLPQLETFSLRLTLGIFANHYGYKYNDWPRHSRHQLVSKSFTHFSAANNIASRAS